LVILVKVILLAFPLNKYKIKASLLILKVESLYYHNSEVYIFFKVKNVSLFLIYMKNNSTCIVIQITPVNVANSIIYVRLSLPLHIAYHFKEPYQVIKQRTNGIRIR